VTYFLSIIALLVVPAVVLCLVLRRSVQWPAFASSLPVIAVIGASWSAIVTANGWWSFGSVYVTGIRVLTHVLIEEVVFYPAGGALSILLYVAGRKSDLRPARGTYAIYLAGGTLGLCALALRYASAQPFYLYSQLVVYNLLVCGGLAPVVAPRIDWRGLAVSTGIMAVLGYAWDHVAFTFGWWEYYAVTHVRVGVVPIDDWAFFLYAPAAAISVYETSARLLGQRAADCRPGMLVSHRLRV
jgi:lycopene cyclase domain-containing protein